MKSILDRYQVQEERRALLLRMWTKQRDFYQKCISQRGIQECIPVEFFSTPNLEPIADFPGFNLNYTKEEYDQHLKNIISLSEEHIGYRFYPIVQPLFDSIRVRVSKEDVVVSRMTDPFISFTFEHPSICDAFVSYAESILKEHYLDKISTRNLLERCVQKPDNL